jgi:hypothetical protein
MDDDHSMRAVKGSLGRSPLRDVVYWRSIDGYAYGRDHLAGP